MTAEDAIATTAAAAVESTTTNFFAFQYEGGVVRLHLYPNIQILLESRPNEKTAGSFEFFDTSGRLLTPFFGPNSTLNELRPVAGPGDEAAVHDRLLKVIDGLRPIAQKAIEEAIRSGSRERLLLSNGEFPRSADDVLPDLHDKKDLDECFELLKEHGFERFTMVTERGARDPGEHLKDFWHNLLCHGVS